MKLRRPAILRFAPPKLRQSIWARCYLPANAKYQGLYTTAALHFAPAMNMALVRGDCISDSIAFTGIYELEFSRRMARLASNPGGLLVDVGANLGYYCLLWAAQRPDNRVIAFEASPRNVPLLVHNMASNGLSERAQVRAEAAGSRCGSARFDLGPADQTGWGGLANEATAETIDVPMTRLDTALAKVDRIAVLKIDVEGADALVLEGAEQLLRERRVANIFFECNRPRMAKLGISPDSPLELLRAYGYESRPLAGVKDGSEYHATPLLGVAD